jgi:outer membrane receptor protein involved in Fe transport
VGLTTNVDNQLIRSRALALDPVVTVEGAVRLTVSGHWLREETTGPGLIERTVSDASGAVVSVDTLAAENVPPSTRRGLAGGAGLEVPAGRWSFDAQARYDHFRTRTDSTAVSTQPARARSDHAASWSLGARFRFEDRQWGQWEPYATWSTGFRGPNLDERYFDGVIHGGLRVFGNADLEPESSRGVEVGIRARDLLRGLVPTLRVSLYRQRVEDLVSLAYLGQLYLVPRFQYVNVEQARLDGLECELGVRLGDARLDLGAAFPRGRDLATGADITDIGRASASARLSVELGHRLHDARLAAQHRWFARIDDDSDFLDADEASVTSLELSAPVAGCRAALSVQNLFDRFYAQQLSIIPEPGRTVAFSLSREFTTAAP